MKISIGFSPCPNDTFIFDALINGGIDTGDLVFEAQLEDVETLNRRAIEGRLDVTKLSFPAFFQSVDTYVLMNAGSALGKGVGPLLVSRTPKTWKEQDVDGARVALPGAHTTANLLFSFAYPNAKQKEFTVFSGIEDAVVHQQADLGVIIHENRFTYQQKGLFKVVDLGELWEQRMKVPIPLGGIAVKRAMPPALQNRIDSLIRQSLQVAFDRYPEITGYVREHAQTMQEEVMRQHIDLYVNNYSMDLGVDGKKAIETLYGVYRQNHQVPMAQNDLFL